MAGQDSALAFRVFVSDESGEMRDFSAGTSKSDMPAWAVKAITNPKAWDDYDPDAIGEEDDGDGEPQSYAKWKKPDLEAEIAKRNEARDADDHIVPDEPGNKPELIAALEADDAAGDGDA